MMHNKARLLGAVVAAASLSVGLAACGESDAASGGAPRVIAGFYPLAYAAEQVGGEAVRVRNLTSPGVEPHDLELTSRRVGEIADADLVIYLSGFQPAVDEAIEQNRPAHVLDAREVVPLDLETTEGEDLATDPHIWLDPAKYAALATVVGDAFGEIDPPNATGYRERATDLARRLNELDAQIAEGLATCERRAFVTSHAAFGYLAARYDLEQIPISGLSPEAEPSPARIQEIQRQVEEHGITTIFFETLVSPDRAEAIARDTGTSVAVLDPIEGIENPAQDDYFTVMRANVDALRKALSCT